MTAPLLFVPGSLRVGSHTTALLRAARQGLGTRWPSEEVDLVRAVPWYDADLEGEAQPPSVLEARRAIRESAGLVVATPEYNGGLPGGLKNVFDWATRPPKEHVLVGKPVALIGASPNSGGARTAVEGLAVVLGYLGAIVVPDPVLVAKAPDHLDPDGSPDAETQARLDGLVERLLALTTTG